MNQKMRNIAAWLGTGSINIFGMPFAGKDTQGRILADAFGGVLVSGGDILRNHQNLREVEQIMASGVIIPSDFYEAMVLPYLARAEFAKRPLILSAVGRAHGEETVVMKAATQAGHPIKAVILLDIPEAAVWERFDTAEAEGGRSDRADDSHKALLTRLQKFRDKTLPVIEFYRAKGLLVKVNAVGTPGQVNDRILDALDKHINK